MEPGRQITDRKRVGSDEQLPERQIANAKERVHRERRDVPRSFRRGAPQQYAENDGKTVGFDERNARVRRIREHAALGPQAEEDAPDVEQDPRASEGEDVKGIGAK